MGLPVELFKVTQEGNYEFVETLSISMWRGDRDLLEKTINNDYNEYLNADLKFRWGLCNRNNYNEIRVLNYLYPNEESLKQVTRLPFHALKKAWRKSLQEELPIDEHSAIDDNTMVFLAC